jgi:hypothetical protein
VDFSTSLFSCPEGERKRLRHHATCAMELPTQSVRAPNPKVESQASDATLSRLRTDPPITNIPAKASAITPGSGMTVP